MDFETNRCLHCGGKAVVESERLCNKTFYKVRCSDCWIQTDNFYKPEDAIKCWNRKAV